MPLSPPALPEEQLHWGRLRLIYKRLPDIDVSLNIGRDYSSVQKALISERGIQRSSYGTIIMRDTIYSRYWKWRER